MSPTRQDPSPTDRYTKLPDALLGVLSPREHQVIHLLLSYRWTPDALIYPSVRTMARRLGCSERTIQRTVRSLEAGGYIVAEAYYRDDGSQSSNRYHPGPALLSLLPAERVTLPPTRPTPERRYPEHNNRTRRNEQRPQPPADPRAYLEGDYGWMVNR